MLKSRVLVCGGRNYYQHADFNAAMEIAGRWFAKSFCIIEGNAAGADALARDWARAKGVPVLTVAANWTVYGNAAGSIRNKWMQQWAMPDLVIAFPGGTGTRDMVEVALANEIEVWEPYE